MGLAKAEQLARERGVTLSTVCCDLAAFEPAPQSVELVVLEERERWIEEGPYHHGQSAVVQVLARKATE
ncbi:hypothetical protein NZK27_05660 [Synechococcus sp. FGCU-3]|nr:hypothetical protein [Synechococcus sp. FGCU3]